MLKIIKIILFLIFLAGFAYGQVYINSMKPVLHQDGEAGETLGMGAIGLGDINGDKYPDFAVGAQGVNKLYIYFGGPGIFDGRPDLKLEGGTDVFFADMNGDGIKDIISQKRGYSNAIDTFFIYPGKKGPGLLIDTIPSIILTGKNYDFEFGNLKAVGDINGDGFMDLVVVKTNYLDRSTGITGIILYFWMGKKNLTKDPDYYILVKQSILTGNSKISISDVNGDGIDDLILGYDYQNYSIPIVYGLIDIYYGKKNFSFNPDRPDQHIDSRNIGMDGINFTWTSLIDINSDGISDMICQKNRDTICIFYGSKDTFRSKEDKILISYDPGNVILFPTIFKIGDINKDGYKDYAILCKKPGLYGIVFYLGGPKGISKDPIAVAYKDCDGGLWGKWTTDIGDVNGDGYDEVLTTSPTDCITFPLEWGYFSIMTGWSDFKLEIKNQNEQVKSNFKMEQNYPNPFNPTTNIVYTIPENSKVKLIVYNALGQEVETLINKEQTAGKYVIVWNPKNIASGVYYYRLTVNNHSEIRKLIFMK
jgi:hypothetical protein